MCVCVLVATAYFYCYPASLKLSICKRSGQFSAALHKISEAGNSHFIKNDIRKSMYDINIQNRTFV